MNEFFVLIYFETDFRKVTEVTYFTENDLISNIEFIMFYKNIKILDIFRVRINGNRRKPTIKKLSVKHYTELAYMRYTKTHLSSLYGNTVMEMINHLDPCKHCPHFDEDEFKCDKIHHCDCDCPDCSPESYV